MICAICGLNFAYFSRKVAESQSDSLGILVGIARKLNLPLQEIVNFCCVLKFYMRNNTKLIGKPKKKYQNYPTIIPAMVAESSDAIVPPINALNPNCESVFRCAGAIEPIPPICIPIDAKLANPQSI